MKNLRLFMLILVVMPSIFVSAQKYVGGDISLLTRYETNGALYYDVTGRRITSLLDFLGSRGLNASRVRLFVNPANAPEREKEEGVCQDLDYVVALGKRIVDAGQAFMLDMHYSDSWADPGKQRTPADWLALGDEELAAMVYSYTKNVLQRCVDEGAAPAFIQTGNEISYGMLWGDAGSTANRCYMGSDDNWQRFADILNSACRACREVCPDAKIVIHTERVGQPDVLDNFYRQMMRYGVDYDIIGLSYYPYFHGSLSTLESAVSLLETNYAGKQIMIVETGYYHDWQPQDVAYDYSRLFPITGEGQKQFAQALIEMLNRHDSVTGLFWWWPEANECGLDWNTARVTKDWYNAGLFDNVTGRAEPALDILRNFVGTAGIEGVPAAVPPLSSGCGYTLSGCKVASPAGHGVYIYDGRKVVVR